jgi:iron complex outermembrane receptor protein
VRIVSASFQEGLDMVRSALFAGISAIALSGGALPSLASAAEVAAKSDDTSLAPVVVTATRKEQSLQSVPVSVAVISGDVIEQSGVQRFEDLGFSVANLSMDTSGHNPLIGTITIRGLTGETGVYLDDVIVGSSAAYNSSLLDVERVEVLRGPQGTTFGANTIAGAINVITKKPSLTAWTGGVSATLGDYGTQNYAGFVSGPITDKFAVKLSAYSHYNDGPDTDASGKHYNGDNEVGFRATALYQPTNNLEVRLTYDYSRLSLKNAFVPELYSTGPITQSLISAGQLPNYTKPTAYKVFGTTDPNILNRNNNGFSARVDWTVGGLKLTSITAYRWENDFEHKDEDYIPIYFAYSDTPQSDRQFTEEIRASGSWGKVDYVGGLFILNNRTASRSTIPLSGDYLNLVGLSPDLFTSFGLPATDSTGGAVFQAITDLRKTESVALFGSADYHVTDRFKVTVGARYTTETDSGSSGAVSSNLPDSILAFGIPGFVYGTQVRPAVIPMTKYPDIKSERFDPSVSLSYVVSPNVNVYASVGTAFKSPGYNSLSNCQNPTSVAPCIVQRETGLNYEAGIKSEWLDHKLRINLVAYDLKLRNAQLYQTIISTVGPNQSAIVNSDETTKGLELEFVAKPIQGLTLDGSLGYEDATYDKYPNASILFDMGGTPPSYCYPGSQTTFVAQGFCYGNATGQTLPFAPKYTGGVSATYDGHVIQGIDWFVRAEDQYRSEYGFQLGTATVTRVKDTNLVNFAIGLHQAGAKGWALTLRGRNVTNQHYFTNAANTTTGETYVNLNDPKMWTIEASYRY